MEQVDLLQFGSLILRKFRPLNTIRRVSAGFKIKMAASSEPWSCSASRANTHRQMDSARDFILPFCSDLDWHKETSDLGQVYGTR